MDSARVYVRMTMRCSLWIERSGSKGEERAKWVRGALHWNARSVNFVPHSAQRSDLTRFAFEEQFIGIETSNDTFQVRQIYLHGLQVYVSPEYTSATIHARLEPQEHSPQVRYQQCPSTSSAALSLLRLLLRGSWCRRKRDR